MSRFTQEFDTIAQNCTTYLTTRVRTGANPPLCRALNCKCARALLTEFCQTLHQGLYPDTQDPPLFCTLYRDADIFSSQTHQSQLTATLLKARFRRWLKTVGLGRAPIWGVLDVCLVTTYNAHNKPLVTRTSLHWHFFINQDDYTPQIRASLRDSLSQERLAGKRPFMAKTVDASQPFRVGYLWKQPDRLNVKARKVDNTLVTNYQWFASGRQLKPALEFLTDARNAGPNLIYTQGMGQVLQKNGLLGA